MQSIYAIYDTVAQELHGNLIRFRHDAAAVRVFQEVLQGDNPIAKHPTDFELVHLGFINGPDEHGKFQLLDDYKVILTGAAWLATQQNSHPQLQEGNTNGR